MHPSRPDSNFWIECSKTSVGMKSLSLTEFTHATNSITKKNCFQVSARIGLLSPLNSSLYCCGQALYLNLLALSGWCGLTSVRTNLVMEPKNEMEQKHTKSLVYWWCRAVTSVNEALRSWNWTLFSADSKSQKFNPCHEQAELGEVFATTKNSTTCMSKVNKTVRKSSSKVKMLNS